MTAPISNNQLWLGRSLMALPALFLLVDGIAKLFKPAPVVEATTQLGYPERVIIALGVTLTLCTILYLIPKTAVLGAILLTGYLGGAVTTHVRVSGPVFNFLFPVFMGVMLWGGLYLLDKRLPALIPIMSAAPATSKGMLWAGRIISGLVSLMLLFSASMKLSRPPMFLQEFERLGYPASTAVGIGILEIVCVLVYLYPRTAMLGAILLTGYLGGATATHVRIGDPFIPPIIGGVLVWVALYLRDERLRALIPVRQSQNLQEA